MVLLGLLILPIANSVLDHAGIFLDDEYLAPKTK